jgi:hypothetical protein
MRWKVAAMGAHRPGGISTAAHIRRDAGDVALAAFGERMAAGKRDGETFEEAWRAARLAIAPRVRDINAAIATLLVALADTEPFWRRCWYGMPAQRDELAALRLVGLLTEPERVSDAAHRVMVA